MAITKIHGIKSTVHKAIDYICNPAKTDNSILVTCFGCSQATADYDFRFALSRTNSADANKAFHLIQSFAPGEATYGQAHGIGIELADRLLEGKYNYIVTTHTDRGHVHNHIIFCAADNIDHKKYNDCKKSYYHIRQLSDELCQEHGLSVIRPDGHGKSYFQWNAETKNTSWKQRIKTDIDEAITSAPSYEEFLSQMRAKGYTISGENFGENEPKYIKFTLPEMSRAVRGSAKNFGNGYTKEEIRERIAHAAQTSALSADEVQLAALTARRKAKSLRTSLKAKITDTTKANDNALGNATTKNHGNRTLIDTSEEKFQTSPGLKRWAEKLNLITAAAAYAQAESLDALAAKITKAKSLAKSARTSLVSTQKQLKELAEIIKYAEQYQQNRIYHVRYEKSKNPEEYFRRHDEQLTLYDGAVNVLLQHGIEPKKMDVDALRAQYEALTAQKTAYENTYKSAEKDAAGMQKQMDTLKAYLKIPENERTTKSNEHEHFT